MKKLQSEIKIIFTKAIHAKILLGGVAANQRRYKDTKIARLRANTHVALSICRLYIHTALPVVNGNDVRRNIRLEV